MNRSRLAIVTAFGICCLLALAAPAPLQAATKARGKVVMLLVDRVSPEEFPCPDTPFISRLAEDSSMGLMGTRYTFTDEAEGLNGLEYVSLGAGTRARGASGSQLNFKTTEVFTGTDPPVVAGEFFRRYSGTAPPPDGVVCLKWQDVLRENEGEGTGPQTGLMGEMLEYYDHPVAVVGNQDSFGRPVRPAPLIVSDRRGVVGRGDVGVGLSVPSADSAGLTHVDVDRACEEARALLGTADLVVVDSGDTARIDAEAPRMSSSELREQKRAAFRRADRLAEKLYDLLDPRESLFMIITPGAPLAEREEGIYQVPCIISGKGFSRGALTSSSTRRAGVVNNTDVLPTVLSFFRLGSPAGVIGAPMRTVETEGVPSRLKRLYAQLEVTRRVRYPVVTGAGILAVALLLLLAACFPAVRNRLKWPKDPERTARACSPFFIVLLCFIPALMLVSLFFYGSALLPALFSLAFCVTLGLVVYYAFRNNRRVDPITFVMLLIVVLMVGDLFLGKRLMMFPLIGVSALDDLRVFGFPNVHAEILMVASVWTVVGLGGRGLADRPVWKYAGFAFLLLTAFVIGVGPMGANFGCSIAALATAMIFLAALSKRGFTPLRVALITLGTVAGTGLIVAMDSLLFRTHVSKALSGSSSKVRQLVVNKLAIHLHEIAQAIVPAILLIFGVLALAVWMKNPRSFWAEQWRDERARTAGIFALITGGLVGFAFNDTGITMLAVLAMMTALIIGYKITRGEFPPSLAGQPALEKGGATGEPEVSTPGG